MRRFLSNYFDLLLLLLLFLDPIINELIKVALSQLKTVKGVVYRIDKSLSISFQLSGNEA